MGGSLKSLSEAKLTGVNVQGLIPSSQYIPCAYSIFQEKPEEDFVFHLTL